MADLFDTLNPEQEQKQRKLEVDDTLQKLLHGREAYKDVVFDASVFSTWVKFDQGLQLIRQKGYGRYPRPSEYFSLLCVYYEGKLSQELIPVAKSMEWSWEWLSLAVQRKGDYLYCYLDPENMVWNQAKDIYVFEGGKIQCTHEIPPFYVGAQEDWVSARDLDSGLVEFLWSRPYEELPQQIKQRNPCFWIPYNEHTGVFGIDVDGVDIGTNDRVGNRRPARGVVVAQNFSNGNRG